MGCDVTATRNVLGALPTLRTKEGPREEIDWKVDDGPRIDYDRFYVIRYSEGLEGRERFG